MRIQKILETLDNVERKKRGLEVVSPDSDDQSYCYSPDLLQDLQLTSLSIPSPHLIRRCRILRPKVTLNIGGSKHEVMWKLLEKKPR